MVQETTLELYAVSVLEVFSGDPVEDNNTWDKSLSLSPNLSERVPVCRSFSTPVCNWIPTN